MLFIAFCTLGMGIGSPVDEKVKDAPRWAKGVRIGEASNPGPANDMDDPEAARMSMAACAPTNQWYTAEPPREHLDIFFAVTATHKVFLHIQI